MRSLISVIIGMIVGVIAIFLVESLGHFVYRPPEGIDLEDTQALAEMIMKAPIGALLFVILAWALGSFIGGYVSMKVAKKNNLLVSLIVGIILMLFGIMNLIMIPHPIWFWIVGLVVFLPAAILGGKAALIKKAI